MLLPIKGFDVDIDAYEAGQECVHNWVWDEDESLVCDNCGEKASVINIKRD